MYQVALSAGSWLSEFWQAFCTKFVEAFKPGDIGEEISEGILQVQHYFDVGDYKLLITDAVIVTWIAVIACVIVFSLMVGKQTIRPNAKQTLLWMIVEMIIDAAMSFGMNRKEAEECAPMIMTFGIVITGCNCISFLKIAPPAKNIAFAVGCAIVAILYVIIISIKFIGFKGFWVSLTTPLKAMLPFKLLDFVIKPTSLALRLFGNVFGSFVFMEFMSIVIPVVVPGIIGLWFDLADGLLQAVIFSYLTMSYIGEIVEIGHEFKEHPEEFKKQKKKKEKEADQAQAAA
ncbi:MAG: FoF1 ATP synthase subunit a [Erysipelotrichaceae bacterium]|nr:FoF1 ATP synthase subunit a [Erysipelotrichaceae bacterium]